MAEELLSNEQRSLLLDKLVQAFMSIDGLKAWLQGNFSIALAQLTGVNLGQELANLISWANSEDGMRNFLQTLANHPPHGNKQLPNIIFALTVGKIKAQATINYGLPDVPPHQQWLAADRPFVNRNILREHLAQLNNSPPGAKCILVIDGEDRSGKSFAVSLVIGCQAPDKILPTIDIDKYARYAATLDARGLASLIVGDEEGSPYYDPTKESEAIPRLMHWMKIRLKSIGLWIVIDHCNRKALTQ